MKFGTALSFVCVGISLLLVTKMRKGKIALGHIGLPILGLIIIMFLSVNTTSVIIGTNLSLTMLFEDSPISTINTISPSRPSLGALVNFTIIVIALMLMLTDFARWRKLVRGIGITVGMIGGIALAGYAFNLHFLYWDFENVSNAMALHTGILFLIAGISLILIGNDKNNPVITGSHQIKTRLISLFLTISIIPIIFLGIITYILIRDFEVIRPFGYGFAIISIIATITAGFFVYVITMQIVRPITNLRDTALAITNGNFDVKAETSTVDEIGQLSKTFNGMIDSIKMATALQLETEKLKQVDKDKEEFAAMVSHELKTPLIPISGYAELFLDGSLGNITEIQREKMQVMYENSIRLTTLIQDILDARKIELKRLNLDIQVESIKEIAKRCIDIFRPIAESKGIRLVDETQDIAIKCDPDRILQVLNNVVSNAMKFVPAQDGTISINSRNDKDEVMISIKDNGIGIPKSKQDDLFKKFYQVDKSLTRKSGGTGLGLAISRGIIEAHGGKIWVESEENQGAAVHFTIQKGNGK
ncbi:MAG: HAMP domain-containing histidine kinase [Nitrosarchaeum sp.]|nr:HAMP domain-containing histidine kinase [Nitrosarchaeum sp.]